MDLNLELALFPLVATFVPVPALAAPPASLSSTYYSSVIGEDASFVFSFRFLQADPKLFVLELEFLQLHQPLNCAIVLLKLYAASSHFHSHSHFHFHFRVNYVCSKSRA